MGFFLFIDYLSKLSPKKLNYVNISPQGKYPYLELLLSISVSDLSLSFICLLNCCTYISLIAIH